VKRREFITILGSAAVVGPLAAEAQQPAVPVIGFLGSDASAWSPWTAAFVERLHALGWIKGHTIAIEYRCCRSSVVERCEQITANIRL
jgi:putative ABC transport system substrate-binding protein